MNISFIKISQIENVCAKRFYDNEKDMSRIIEI